MGDDWRRVDSSYVVDKWRAMVEVKNVVARCMRVAVRFADHKKVMGLKKEMMSEANNWEFS